MRYEENYDELRQRMATATHIEEPRPAAPESLPEAQPKTPPETALEAQPETAPDEPLKAWLEAWSEMLPEIPPADDDEDQPAPRGLRFYASKLASSDKTQAAILIIGSLTLLILSVLTCYLNGVPIVFSSPVVFLSAGMAIQVALTYAVSEEAAETFAFAGCLALFHVTVAAASLVRTIVWGPASDDRAGCRACSADLRWAAYLSVLLAAYYSDFWPLVIAFSATWAARAFAEGAVDEYYSARALGHQCAASALAESLVPVVSSLAAFVCYAVLGGQSTTALVLATLPVFAQGVTSTKCTDAAQRGTGPRVVPKASTRSFVAFSAEVLASAVLLHATVMSPLFELAAILNAVNCCLVARRFHCLGVQSLLMPHSKLRTLRRLSAAEQALITDVCPVCLLPFDRYTVMTACRHSFHGGCIRRCLDEKPNCPMCQRVIVNEELELPGIDLR